MFDYQELKSEIAKYIDSLELHEGDRLPTESKLCRKFEATHYQVRKVLADLGNERDWVTIQGSGTYLPGGSERRPRERVIAVVRPYFRDVMVQMAEAHSLALENNFQFLVFGIDHLQTTSEEECLNHLLTRRLHSLIIDPHPGHHDIAAKLDAFVAQGTRVILLNGSAELRKRYLTYSFNYYRAGYMALVHVMRSGVKKAIHISPHRTIAWQHGDFLRGVDDAGRDFGLPVERYYAKMMLDVRDFSWTWRPDEFRLPLEGDCGYIDDNDPYEASYVQNQLGRAGLRNTPVISVYHTAGHVACVTLLFNMRERMKWIVNELIEHPNDLPKEQYFNPVLAQPSESPEYQLDWG